MKKELSKQLAFIKMRVEGKTLLEISNDLGISFPTAVRWNKAHKSDVLQARNAQVENLRKKIMDRYNSYFDFLDSQLERLKAEIALHKEIAMTYPNLIKFSIKILEAQNRINIFRKYSYKPPDQDITLDIEDIPADQESSQEQNSPPEQFSQSKKFPRLNEDSPPDDGSRPDEGSPPDEFSQPEQAAANIENNPPEQAAANESHLRSEHSANIKNNQSEQSAANIENSSA